MLAAGGSTVAAKRTMASNGTVEGRQGMGGGRTGEEKKMRRR